MYCIICGKPLRKLGGTNKTMHVHKKCREDMKRLKTRYCWMCGDKLTAKNRKGCACLCFKCNNEKNYAPIKKNSINSRKALLDEAEKLLRKTPFLKPIEVYDILHPRRGNDFEFDKRHLLARMKGDRLHRFKLEGGLWSLRTPEGIHEFEVELERAKGMI